MKQVRIEGQIVEFFEQRAALNRRSLQGEINEALQKIMDEDE